MYASTILTNTQHDLFTIKKDCFKKFFLENYNLYVHFATKRLGSREDAKDVVQAAMTSLYEQLKVQEIAYPNGYVIQSIIHDCGHRQRVQERQALIEETFVQQNFQESSWRLSEDIISFLMSAIQMLTPQRKTVIYLLYFHKMRHREVAKLLGTTVNAVKSDARRAKHRLRSIFIHANMHEDIFN